MEYRKFNDKYIIRINGGHLVKSRISATSEIILSVMSGEVQRKLSKEIGLNLLKF